VSQRQPTKAEKGYWDALIRFVGCVACRVERRPGLPCLIHHVDGRTKPGCHRKVLPLCAPHHQDDGTKISVHPWKKRFELQYGTQEELMALCDHILRDAGYVVPWHSTQP
jgi:hypothetical protein